MLKTTQLRVARPTDDLEAVAKFYREGLGLKELYRFADHDGFDGVMLGQHGAPYHLEFTRAHGHRAGRAPTRAALADPAAPVFATIPAPLSAPRLSEGAPARRSTAPATST